MKLVSAKILGTKKIVKQNHDRKNPFVFQEPRHPEDFPEFSIPGSFFFVTRCFGKFLSFRPTGDKRS